MISNKKTAVTYFIADLHLCESRPDITGCFLTFLQHDAPQAEQLFILGDLFETWVGDDDDDPDPPTTPMSAYGVKEAVNN